MSVVQTANSVSVIVQAIVSYFGGDYERVLTFYNDADPKLRGVHPLFDEVRAALVEWLIDARFRKYSEPQLHGEREFIDQDGNRHMVNLDEIEFDEL